MTPVESAVVELPATSMAGLEHLSAARFEVGVARLSLVQAGKPAEGATARHLAELRGLAADVASLIADLGGEA